jgi:hypothetical protein
MQPVAAARDADYPNWVHGITGTFKILGSILWPVGGAMAMAAMLSGYFAVTTGVLVSSIQVLRRGRRA